MTKVYTNEEILDAASMLEAVYEMNVFEGEDFVNSNSEQLFNDALRDIVAIIRSTVKESDDV